MSGIRVYELSRELNVQNKVLIDLLSGMGYPVKSHSSSIEFHLADRLRRQVKMQGLGKKPKKKAAQAETAEPVEAEAEPAVAEVAPPATPKAPEPMEEPPRPVAQKSEPEEVETHKEPIVKRPVQASPPVAAAPAAEPAVKRPAQAPAPAVKEQVIKRLPVTPPSPTKGFMKIPPPRPQPQRPASPRPGQQRRPTTGRDAGKDAGRETRPSMEPQRERFGSHSPGKVQVGDTFTPERPAGQRPSRGGAPGAEPSRRAPGGKKGDKKGRDVPKWKKDSDSKSWDDDNKKGKGKIKGKKERGPRLSREEEEARRKAEAEERELQQLIEAEEREKAAAEAKKIVIDEATTVKEFAEKTRQSVNSVISKLIGKGIMATLNQTIDVDMAREMALEIGMELVTREEEEEKGDVEEVEDHEKMIHRSPVVTIMGHVDHGKTSLLDTIRKTRVTEEEEGGITQRVGAYVVAVPGKGNVVFLDTPGHEAFTALRARGASVTDLVVLVVAADDGVMPQTLEAIHHAEAAKVPVVVAINKIDKPGADPDRIRQELTAHGLVAEEWGGQTIFCQVSAKQKVGIENLLEMILLQAEVLELRANPDRPGVGTIIESRLDKGRGPVATVLVQRGTLKVGDAFVAGIHSGKVRALMDDLGKRCDLALPSTPVEVLGFTGVPAAGEVLMVVESERKAHQIAMKRKDAQRVEGLTAKGHVKLENLHAQITRGEMRDLNIIIKADLQGSIEAMQKALGDLKIENIRINILHSAVGGITETDVSLATASNAIVIGFNVRPTEKAKAQAETDEVDVRLYGIIYNVIDDIKKALEGMLEPIFKEVVTGRAEARQVFNVSGVGAIAGCSVQSGKITRNSDARLIRDSVVVYTGRVTSLKRFKDDAKEVLSGYECGIGLEKFNDIKAHDIIETFESQEVERKESKDK
ncbi:MAG: translation initiation factor IF-2 [Nitrospinota bacterium]|nr:translation initiation factor IF-2 [Nitrospinota bacterium]